MRYRDSLKGKRLYIVAFLIVWGAVGGIIGFVGSRSISIETDREMIRMVERDLSKMRMDKGEVEREVQRLNDYMVEHSRMLGRKVMIFWAVLIYIGVLIAAAVENYWLNKVVLEPVNKLFDGTKQVASGDLEHKVGIHSRDEFGALGDSFNRMTEDLKKLTDALKDANATLEERVAERTMELQRINEELEREMSERRHAEEAARLRQAQLLQASKMTSLGTLVSGVAHEVNNPNNFIMFNTPLIASAWLDALPILEEHYRKAGDFQIGGLPYSEMKDAIPRLLTGIGEGASRIKDIVDNLKDFARPDRASMDEAVDLNKVVSSSVSIVGNQIKKRTDNFAVEFAEGLPTVKGNARQLEQVVINLIMNALDALPDRGRGVSVSTRFSDGTIMLEVKDEGTGIDREDLERVTEPFFTTKLDSGGTGLGLSISYSIIKEHGGSLEFESASGQGTRALVRLPRNKEAAA